MIRTAPPQYSQVSMSIRNTRLRRCAQVMAWRRSGSGLEIAESHYEVTRIVTFFRRSRYPDHHGRRGWAVRDSMTKEEDTTGADGTDTCANCDAPLAGEYCAACGQARTQPLSVRGMFRQAATTLFDLDRGFFHTVRAMFTRPGQTCRAYVEGQRQPLTGPFKYAFIVITIYAVTINLLGIEIRVPGVEAFDETERRLFFLINSLLGYLIFFIMIPVAAIQRLLFRASGDSLGDTYAFALYLFGTTSWFSTLLALTGWLDQPRGLTALGLITITYAAWAMGGFYGHVGRPPVLRATLMIVVNLALTNLIALLLGNLIVYLGLLEPLADALS